MINVLVVDDSALMRKMVSEMLNSASNIRVVGTARDGLDAIEKTEKLRPDVVTMDVEMPRMDGLTALCYIMAKTPVPVVMLTAMDKIEADLAVKSFEYGAVDFVSKPSKTISLDIEEVKNELISKVRAASTVNTEKMVFKAAERRFIEKLLIPPKSDKKVLVIGASTGGPNALSEIIPKLHRTFPLAVLIVQHLPIGFTKSFSERLSWQGSIALKEAEDGDAIKPGQAFVAPSGYHIVVKNGRMGLNKRPKGDGMRSIDAAMKSAADAYEDKVIGVLLSGMGKDGAEGMRAIKERGGSTIAQDELTSVIFGMPKAAIEMGVVDKVASLPDIVDEIIGML
ncbi:MAG: chemotaxis response regulator protein-glutamate methylesterase [Halobacteriota archaeon]